MGSIENVQIEAMQALEPDYLYYARFGKLTLVEFSLIVHRINPELYSPTALDMALMFFPSESGPLLPQDVYVPKRLFLMLLEEAYKTYNILKRVEWSIKYANGLIVMNEISIDWLVAEAHEKGLSVPDEFLMRLDKIEIEEKQYEDSAKGVLSSPVRDKLEPFSFKGNDLIFGQSGEHFYVEFDKQHATFKKNNGFVYLEYLLKNPNKDISPIVLYRLIYKEPAELHKNNSMGTDYGFFIEDCNFDDSINDDEMDEPYKESCQKKINEINEELSQLDKNTPKAKDLLNEKNKIEQIFHASSGKKNLYGNKSRQFTNMAEKIRQNVSKAIHGAFVDISKYIPDLERHLKEKIRVQNYFWKYSSN